MELLQYQSTNADPLPRGRLTAAGVLLLLAATGPGIVLLDALRRMWRHYPYFGERHWMLVQAAIGGGFFVLLAGLAIGLFTGRRWAVAITRPVTRNWLGIGLVFAGAGAWDLLRTAAPLSVNSVVRVLVYRTPAIVLTLAIAIVWPGTLLWLLRDGQLVSALIRADTVSRWTDRYRAEELGVAATLLTFAAVGWLMRGRVALDGLDRPPRRVRSGRSLFRVGAVGGVAVAGPQSGEIVGGGLDGHGMHGRAIVGPKKRGRTRAGVRAGGRRIDGRGRTVRLRANGGRAVADAGFASRFYSN